MVLLVSRPVSTLLDYYMSNLDCATLADESSDISSRLTALEISEKPAKRRRDETCLRLFKKRMCNGSSNIIFLGPAESGKSSLISAIMGPTNGEEWAREWKCVQGECGGCPTLYQHRKYNLIDTPGLLSGDSDQFTMDVLHDYLHDGFLHKVVIVLPANIRRLEGPTKCALSLYATFLGEHADKVIFAFTGECDPGKSFRELALVVQGEYGSSVPCFLWNKVCLFRSL